MAIKLAAGLLAGIFVLVAAQGCVFGGGDGGGSSGELTRPGVVVTATLPATLTDPVVLGQSQAATGTSGGGATAGASGQTYSVQSGDTLGGIATSMGVPPDQQAAWIAEVLRLNGMADARSLAVGQELILPRTANPTATARTTGTPPATTGTPARTTTPGTPTAAGTATPRPTQAGGSGRSYTVVSGDTPLVIAEKLGVPEGQRAAWANELVTLNDIDASSMQIGDVLQLPAGTP